MSATIERAHVRLCPHIILLLLCCFFPSFVHADPVETLTWQDCVTEAIKNNPDLQSSQQDIRISKEDKHLTEAGLLPQISGTAQRQWSDGSSSSFSGTTGTSRSPKDYSYGVSAQQLLFDGFKTAYDVKSASKDVTASKLGYAVTSADIRYQLRSAFVDLLKAQEMVGLTKNIAARRSQNYQLINLRYLAGREHRGSLLTAQANLASASASVTQAERDLLLSQRLLIKMLGRTLSSPVQVKETVTSTSRNKAKPNFELIANEHPYYKQMTAQKESNRFALDSAKSDLFPEVSLDTSVDQSSTDWPPDETDWSAGINVSLPIFEGGTQIHQIQKNKAQYKQSMADQQSAYNALVYTLQEAWTTWQDAIDTYWVQQQYLTAAVERSTIANAQYSTGLITFNDWTIIEDNLVTAQRSFLTAKMDVLLTEAEWLKAEGETLDDIKK